MSASILFPYKEENMKNEFLLIELQGELVHYKEVLERKDFSLGNLEKFSDTVEIPISF